VKRETVKVNLEIFYVLRLTSAVSLFTLGYYSITKLILHFFCKSFYF